MINFDEEARLDDSSTAQEHYDELANLYSIIVSLDFLERSYIRDNVKPEDYIPACSRLINQYTSALKLLGSSVTDIDSFTREYRLTHYTAALGRIKEGAPSAIVEDSADQGQLTKWVAETTQNFITLMDALKLNLRAKDQLHPILSELMSSYVRFANSNTLEGRPKMVNWLIKLNSMRASDELSEEESRQMLFDIEHAYSEFFKSLSSK